MPIMNRMRDNMPLILIGLIVAFILTIVFEWGMDYLGMAGKGASDVGSINGKRISYQQFAELVRTAAETQKAQTKAEADEEQTSQIRDQVWNNLVTQALLEEEVNRLGIVVTDDEIIDWVRGPNPPDFLRRQFTDSLGNFNRAAYENAIQDPRNKDVWIQVELGLRQQRLQEKLQSVLLAGVRATEGEIMQRFVDQNQKFDIQYILFDVNKAGTDEEFQVTDADLKKFFNEHADEYRSEETRQFKYVLFKEEASAQDTQAVLNEMAEIVQRVKAGSDFTEIAGQYGNVRKGEAFMKPGELSPAKESAVFGAKPGQIVGPVIDVDGIHLFKIEEEKIGADEFVNARHILISVENNDSVAALKKAREILASAQRGDSFEELAKQHSKDPGSGAKGGDLGWFGKGRMVKPFEEAAFKAPIGKIVGPVRTQFGYHIIKVEAKNKRQVRVTDFSVAVKAGNQTRSRITQRAQDFAYLAKENGFLPEAEQLGLKVLETGAFTKGSVIPGIGMNEVVSRFAFREKVGTISDVLTIQFGHLVCLVTEARPAGVKPFEDVKASVQARTIRQKKMEKMKTRAVEVRNSVQPGSDLHAVGQTHPDLSVVQTGSFTSSFIPTIGRDPVLAGAISGMNTGDISQPVEGTRGYYIAKLNSKSDFDSTSYKSQHEFLRNSITQEKRNRFLSEWLEGLKKSADIVDNRDLFFR